MKKFFMMIFLALLSFSVFGQIRSMEEYRERKIDFYCVEDFNEVVEMVGKEIDFLHEHKDEYEEDVYLTLENMLYVDQLFFSLVDNELPKDKKANFKEIFLNQESKTEDFIGNKKYSEVSGDLLLSLGDLKCQMPYVVAITTAIPKLTKAKTLYENAVINNPDSCAGLISKALWYLYSPGISGGSKKKAYQIIQQAENAAKIKADKFFSLCFKAQIENALKKNDQCMDSLKAAHELFPNEVFTGFIAKNLNTKMDF